MPESRLYRALKWLDDFIWLSSPFGRWDVSLMLLDLVAKDLEARRVHREQSQLWRDRMVG